MTGLFSALAFATIPNHFNIPLALLPRPPGRVGSALDTVGSFDIFGWVVALGVGALFGLLATLALLLVTVLIVAAVSVGVSGS